MFGINAALGYEQKKIGVLHNTAAAYRFHCFFIGGQVRKPFVDVRSEKMLRRIV